MPMAIADYSALAGKIRAMYGKLLKTEHYRELMHQKSVGDVAAYLKYSTPYHEVLADVNENNIHRAQFENILKKSLANDYRKIFCFSRGNVREFLKIAWLRHEVDSVKRLFRMLEMEGTTTLAKDSLLFLEKFDILDVAKLAQVHNSREFIANLRGTGYYQVLKPLLADDEKHNLFHIEMSLDMYYFNFVLSKMKKLLQGLDAEVVELSLGIEIDVSNLLWIFRGRIVYDLDRSIILGYLIPHTCKLSREVLSELSDAKDEEAFRRILSGTGYAELFLSDQHSWYELNFTEYMASIHRSFLHRYGFSISGALSYLHLKEFELSNIISIIEGIRYQLPPDDIMKYIAGIRFFGEQE